MRDRVSVLAGPSGVGKSSIINALRAEAFDEVQRGRLEVFERKMAEEFEWLQGEEEAHSDSEDPHEDEASTTPLQNGASSGV